MKYSVKVLIVVSLMVFCSKHLFSQYDGMRFGLKGAPSIAWYQSESKNIDNGGSKIGFSYGLMAEFPFTDNAAFATGFEIMNAGGKLNFETIPDNPYYAEEADTFNLYSRNYKVRYANIPLGLKFKTNEIGYMMFYGNFGVDAGFKVKALADDEGLYYISGETNNENIDINDDVNFIRLGLNIGAGIEYYISGTTHLVVGVNFNNGFTNLLEKESYNIIDKNGEALEQSVIGNFVGLNVGILF